MDRRYTAVYVSIGVNILLVIIKIVLADISGSIALLADALHSASDIFVSFLVLLSLTLSDRVSKKIGPVEGIMGVIITLAIFGTAYNVFYRVIETPPQELQNVPIVLLGTLVCIMISYFLAKYKIHVGTETSSLSLKADGFHSKVDMYSSIAVMVGVTGQMIGLELDKVAAVVIALLIVEAGVEVLVSTGKAIFAGQALELDAVLKLLRDTTFGKRVEAILNTLSDRVKPELDLERCRIFLQDNIRGIILLVSLAGAGGYILSGWYVIKPDEVGILLRFGKLKGDEINPGPGYHWPYPIEKLIRVNKERVERIEIGFRSKTKEEEPDLVWKKTLIAPETSVKSGLQPYELKEEPVKSEEKEYLWGSRHRRGSYTKDIKEALILTGDENIIDLNMVVQYKIKSAREFLFRAVNPSLLLKATAEFAIREIAGHGRMDDILTEKRSQVEEKMKIILQKELDKYQAGMLIKTVRLQDVHPPLEVVGAFRDVASAREDKDRMINQALGYQNELLPEAAGQARKMVIEAEAYREEKANRARGEATKFLAIRSGHKDSKEVTELRMYFETMEEALSGVDKFIVSSKKEGSKYTITPQHLRCPRECYDCELKLEIRN
ncbi:MAG: FtsH protease activity modulator HflK [bacterium]|nr:FtsH protease activity modulator HflK [bacterium]